MPTTSSYYSDLEYPTVNEDGTTYGGIINTYINELLAKLYAVSQRVTTAQSQLNSINQGVNAVDIINTTLAGAIGSNPLLSGTGTTLLPDPYSGTYTKTTTWPAYASSFSGYGGGSIAVPTTVSEINSFDFEGYKDVLLAELARIEAVVDQAEADILAAQQDTCRTRKIIDAIGAGPLELVESNDLNYGNTSSSFTKISDNTVQIVTSTGNLSGTYVLGSQGVQAYLDHYNEGETVTVLDIRPGLNGFDSDGYYNSTGQLATVSISKSGNTYTLITSFNAFTQMATTTGTGYFVIADLTVSRGNLTPDFSSCTSPSPPYFIS